MTNTIIFDLDGTLWDVTDCTYQSINLASKKFGYAHITKETVISIFGHNKFECAKIYFPDLDFDISGKILDVSNRIKLSLINNKTALIYDNVYETIKSLSKKYDLYIVSNAFYVDYIEKFLEVSSLNNYFKGYIAASFLNISKAEAIKRIISDNNFKKSIYVGDTIIDQEASIEAGVEFVWAKYGFGKDLKNCYQINNFLELPSVAKSIFGRKDK